MTIDATPMSWFNVSKRESYAETRRGIPCRPSQCIGMKVALKPMKMTQKLITPRRSLYIFPVIFGNQ